MLSKAKEDLLSFSHPSAFGQPPLLSKLFASNSNLSLLSGLGSITNSISSAVSSMHSGMGGPPGPPGPLGPPPFGSGG